MSLAKTFPSHHLEGLWPATYRGQPPWDAEAIAAMQAASPPSPVNGSAPTSPAWNLGPSPLPVTLRPVDQPGTKCQDPAIARHAGNTMKQMQRAVAASACVTLVCDGDFLQLVRCVPVESPLKRTYMLQATTAGLEGEEGTFSATENGSTGSVLGEASLYLCPIIAGATSLPLCLAIRALPQRNTSTRKYPGVVSILAVRRVANQDSHLGCSAAVPCDTSSLLNPSPVPPNTIVPLILLPPLSNPHPRI